MIFLDSNHSDKLSKKFVNLVLPTHQNWRNNRVNNSIQILFVAHSTIKQRLRLIRSD